MYPYINNIDISKPIGRLVYNYGFDQYYKGIITGFLIGISFSGCVYIISKIYI